MASAQNIILRAMLNRAMACHRSGKLEEAIAIYREGLSLEPHNGEILFLLGTAELQCGRAEASAQHLQQSLAALPNRPRTHLNLALALQTVGRFEEALSQFDTAIALEPESAEAYFHCANLFLAWKRNEDALACYNRALELKPDYAEALYNRGTYYLTHRQPAKALTDFDGALRQSPDLVKALNNKGNALRALRRAQEALETYEAANARLPGQPANCYNRAIVLTELARPAEALTCCNQALALNPQYAEAWCCRGNILKELGHYAEALTNYNHALAQKPGDPQTLWDMSLVELLTGDFAKGWTHYELRWLCGIPVEAVREYGVPQWQGEPCEGKTVLVHAEQGFGDSIQFSRYIPMLAARGAKIVIEALPTLHPLLATLEGDYDFLDDGAPLPPNLDFHCPVMSLARVFTNCVESIPGRTPYLSADPDKCKLWREKLGTKTRPRIGLVWSGRAGLAPDRTRSIACETMTPLFDLDAEFHCLQKEIRPTDDGTLSRFPQIKTHTEELGDFADTAALVGEMDLVIAVDTSIAHLAGALARPVWVLLPFSPDWRWLLNRDDSPWYPTARLFRQDRLHDWPGVVERTKAALKDYLSIQNIRGSA